MKRYLFAEALIVVVLAAALASSVPLSTDAFFWSWDGLNHHVYLGLIAEQPRWQLDVTAASGQSYQYPYLYWPAYKLPQWFSSGAVAGAAWSATNAALLTLPTWLICLRLLPGSGDRPWWHGTLERTAACGFAAMSVVVLTGLETTANDVLAAVPLLWAVWVSLGPRSHRRAFWAAVLWGVSVAFKLSNGLFLPLLMFWWWQPQAPRLPWRRGLSLTSGASLGFLALYAPWGWQLWKLTGNPFYPFLGNLLGPG